MLSDICLLYALAVWSFRHACLNIWEAIWESRLEDKTGVNVLARCVNTALCDGEATIRDTTN